MLPRKPAHKHRLPRGLFSHSCKRCSSHWVTDLVSGLNNYLPLPNLERVSIHIDTSSPHLYICFAYGKHPWWWIAVDYRSEQHCQLKQKTSQSSEKRTRLPFPRTFHTQGCQTQERSYLPFEREDQASRGSRLSAEVLGTIRERDVKTNLKKRKPVLPELTLYWSRGPK